jgi:flagellar hook-associated protein 1 FlgK
VSLSDILSSALSGLGASQAGMRTVSNNIANVNTPGYARERVSLETAVTAGRTSGVKVGEPNRVADRFLESTVYARATDAGRAEATSDYLDRLQTLLGASGAESGLPARLDAVSSAATAMVGTAGGGQTGAAFVGEVADALESMRQLDKDIDGLRIDVEGEVGYTVERVNTLLRNIYDLNDAVSRLDGQGRSSAGSADLRVSAIEELSGLIGITAREQADGRINIDTTAGLQLVDKRLRQLTYAPEGTGVAQPVYPSIDVRFADPDGKIGAATGEKIDSAGVNGKLGGLIDLRDRQLPAVAERLGTLFGGFARALNTASNNGTAVPAPSTLEGRATALTGADRLGFTGAATFAVTKADGTLVAKTRVDFSNLDLLAGPPGVTVDDAVSAINTGLGGAGTVSFSAGKLVFSAAAAGNGVVVAQDATAPSDRAGAGFSQYFGLNDLVRSDSSTLTSSGFTTADPHRFAAGEAAEIALRDTSGKMVARYTLSGGTGTSFGDLKTALNGSPLAAYGAFDFDDKGRLQFEPTALAAGSTLSILSDDTDRGGTGRSFSAIVGLTGDESGLQASEVRRDINASPAKLPLALLQDVLPGQKALGTGDRRSATNFVDSLTDPFDLGKDGFNSISRFANVVLGDTGTSAARAQVKLAETTERRDDAIARRDNFSGVSIDEELAQMVVLQNSYSAAARVMTSANAMYDTLLGMLG